MLYTYEPGIGGVTRTSNVNALGKFNMSITTYICYCLICLIGTNKSYNIFLMESVGRYLGHSLVYVYTLCNEKLHASHKYINTY